jgi:NAD(P)-dependent dehydrogenase (short-subunit alcohol dehydrogenase family)
MNVKELFDLSGRIALITGGSRGLGLQMAEALGDLGAKIAISARKQNELVLRHSDYDWLILSQFRMGRSSGATRIWMLRATPG